MRFFCFFILAGSLMIAATHLIDGDRSRIAVDAKEPAKPEVKKDLDKKAPQKKTRPSAEKLDEEILRRAKLAPDGAALIAFLKKRMLPEKDRPELERLIPKLGSIDFRTREKANHALVERGVAALDVLRFPISHSPDYEVTRRIERSIQTIHDRDIGPGVLLAAIRVAALHPAAGLVETLIGYLPFTDSEAVLEELRWALTRHALEHGKADPLLLAALSDRSAIRRATAAEVLVRAAYADNKDTLRKLLGDRDAMVRYRVARALVLAHQADAIPSLIDTLPDLPLNAAWQAEDFLLHLTASAPAPTVAMGQDKDARVKCQAAWQEWWKKYQTKIDLTKVEETPRMLGRTLIVLLDQNSVIELGPDNLPRLEIKGVLFPLDAQVIDDGRVLVAEYHANRVTERDARGEILWRKDGIQGPQVAQRLPNGNTFIATAFKLLEYDKQDNLVLDLDVSGDKLQKIMKAMKLDNGDIVCMLADARIVRYDARGNELSSFPIQLGTRLFGGRIHMLANGRVLVPHNAEGKVVEYDSRGKIVWEVPFEQPIAAMRLPNGNTLITSMDPWVGAVEVDRAGAHVWSYQHTSNTRVTRAIRR
jgi:HEAT repeat protein